MERFEAVTEPSVSNCVAAGSRYAPSLRTLANIAALAEGYGSITTISSSFFIASIISEPRDWLFGAWPQKMIALRFGSWSIASFFSVTPSIQRETVMPGLAIIASQAKRFFSQSRSTFHTLDQWVQVPGTATG